VIGARLGPHEIVALVGAGGMAEGEPGTGKETGSLRLVSFRAPDLRPSRPEELRPSQRN